MNHRVLLPYAHWNDQPDAMRRPTILGAPTRTEFYRVRETGIPNPVGPGVTTSPGAQIEFTRNGIVTAIQAKANLPMQLTHEIGIEVVKDGQQFLATDGYIPKRMSPFDFVGTFGVGPWVKTWIPVNAGEIWKINCENPNPAGEWPPLSYSFAVRCERFLEKPESIPEYLTETVFYKMNEIVEENVASGGAEWDFLRDGIVTGISANAIPHPQLGDPSMLTGLELDILLEGQIHLSNAKQTISPIDVAELSPAADPWFPLWFPVSQHEKWQCFARNVGQPPGEQGPRSYHLIGRVEQVRVPWNRW